MIFDKKRSFWLLLSAAFITLALVSVYSWLYLQVPSWGFRWDNKTWEVSYSGQSGCRGGNEACIALGDELIEVNGYSLEEYKKQRFHPTVDWFKPLHVKLLRGSNEISLVVEAKKKDLPGTLEALQAVLFSWIFLGVGVFALLILRPRDKRWLLQVLLYFCIAIFFASGFLVFTRWGFAALVSRVFGWLLAALLIHLHLILPAPLGQWVSRAEKPLYGGVLVLLALDVLSILPEVAFRYGLILSLLITLGIILLRLGSPSRLSERISVRLMLFGALLGVLPWLMAMALFYLYPLEDLPLGMDSAIIAGVSLVVLPNWPLAYICSMYKPDLGRIRLRGNRLLGIYGFFSLSIAFYVTGFFFVGLNWLSLRQEPIVSSLLMSVFFLTLAPFLRIFFQNYVDRNVFAIKYSPEKVVNIFAEKIPGAFGRQGLEVIIEEEVLTTLAIEQSALCLWGRSGVEVLYSQGLSGGELERLLDMGRDEQSGFWGLLEDSLEYIRADQGRHEEFPWVRLVVPLAVGDQVVGIWLFGSREPDNFYPRSDIELLHNIANQVGVVVRAQLEVSENKKLHQQLVHAQKMEAIGRLSAGVAHDFNNLLTAILSYSDLLLLQFPSEPVVSKYITGIRDAGEKAEALTKQLLAFSRRQAAEVKVVDVNKVVLNIEKLLRRLVGEDVHLKTRLGATFNVRVDPRQLEQVILNLVVNANDAMPEGGDLWIETCDISEGRGRSFEHSEVKGRVVCLKVRDSGVGIDPDIVNHIFEPFFTTKEMSKGTGLGLAMVYGIVRQSDGFITVDSEPGGGATFEVYLPAIDEVETEDTGADAVLEASSDGAVILVVEDEETVRNVACEILETNGFQVLRAADGLEALEVYKRHKGQIDLLLTDVVMPQMKGPELAERLLAETPDLKILYMSGYYEKSMFGRHPEELEDRLIRKPFSSTSLLRQIREFLDAVPSSVGPAADPKAPVT